MGDRVLFQVVDSFDTNADFSPVVYGHSCASEAPAILERLAERMKTRAGDVSYIAARLVQEVANHNDEDLPEDSPYRALSVGMWGTDKVLTADDSHGDGGCVLIAATPEGLRYKCMGGYLTVSDDGTKVTSPY